MTKHYIFLDRSTLVLVNENPYSPPPSPKADAAETTQDNARHYPPPPNRDLRVFVIAFCTASFFAIASYTAANLYARTYDPWLTPRYTHYMLVWHRIGTPMFQLMLFLVPTGLILAFAVSNRRQRWIVLSAVAIMILLPFTVGIP